MVVYNAQLLHSQSYYANSINISCWVLHILTTSYLESNHDKFRIGMQSTFKPVEIFT
jgi:hypothetical protein